MANGFVKNAHRVDPYKTYKFRVAVGRQARARRARRSAR